MLDYWRLLFHQVEKLNLTIFGRAEYTPNQMNWYQILKTFEARHSFILMIRNLDIPK